jgi:cytochrome c biogenesis protein CcmG/thiol:disulfide interchange protein DsbE
MTTTLARRTLLLTAALAIASLSLPASASPSAPTPDHPMLGEAAPEFRLTGLDGKEIALSDLRGSMLVLHFGASW